MTSVTKQQFYRRLMKEQKSSKQNNKINHPLARYNALDQLTCVLCNVQLKSEILWNTHLQSRKHKDCVNALKAAKSSPVATPSSAASSSIGSESGPLEMNRGDDIAEPPASREGKRKAAAQSEHEPPQKKKKKGQAVSATPAPTKSGLPSNFFDAGVKKKFHGHGEEVFYESSDSEEEAAMPATKGASDSKKKEVASNASASNLPEGFIDEGSETIPSEQEPPSKTAIPEGFFDDPKMDAKARHVEYKDPMTEEWERFQKSIQKEDDISEVILFEGDEETMEERELDEVNQQVHCFTKAEELRQRHEKVLANRMQQQLADNSPSNQMDTESEDETDFEEFLNWRAKIS